MPLKIIWAVLDIITIIVLWTGLYLWLRRRKPRVSPDRQLATSSSRSETSVMPS
jgi:uncharacterized iron-regulated membrane protein